MSEDLFFIPILAKALQDTDPKTALKAAFEQIKQLGQQEQYRQGYAQFEAFMAEAQSNCNESDNRILRELITELATQTYTGSPEEKQAILDIIRSQQQWQSDYEAIQEEAGLKPDQKRFPVIQIYKDNHCLKEMSFSKTPGCQSVDGITPGEYVIKLNIGQTIWEGQLSSADLIWTEAYPDRQLNLAAETEGVKEEPIRKIALWDGEIILSIYAGLESGRIEVELTK